MFHSGGCYGGATVLGSGADWVCFGRKYAICCSGRICEEPEEDGGET